MHVCVECGDSFEAYPVVNGVKLNLKGRQRCLSCLPLRRLSGPRKPVFRGQQMKTCERCGALFAPRVVIDGKVRNLNGRRFCLDCSPFGMHNTSKVPPGALSATELLEYRRKKRNAKTYRYQKKKRRTIKAELVTLLGGRCVDCGYNASTAALDFHHRDPAEKEFAISHYTTSLKRLLPEALKCDLVCANCHAIRHAQEDARIADVHAVVEFRRTAKGRAVREMGGVCGGCGRAGPAAIFQFHHLDPTSKDFGISQDGIPRRWDKVLAELAKCVMLCANCHREVHAGVRQLPARVSEDALPYAA